MRFVSIFLALIMFAFDPLDVITFAVLEDFNESPGLCSTQFFVSCLFNNICALVFIFKAFLNMPDFLSQLANILCSLSNVFS